MDPFHKRIVPFVLSKWAKQLTKPPSKRLQMGHFPTPIHPFHPPGVPQGVHLLIKRDDYSGLETSGNKMRKLEFLLADAIEKEADCIVTCGGIQSNHCRATALAAKMLGMDAFLLLRSDHPDIDPGLVGNLLLDRLIDAQLIQMSRTEYGKYGSQAMIQRTCERLEAKNRRPYPIPVGGSNGLGTWGYLQAVEEIHTQLKELDLNVTDLAFACGSGGTAAGLALGSYLYSKHFTDEKCLVHDGRDTCKPPIHAYIVCDKDEYFYQHIDNIIFPEMGVPEEISSRHLMQITNAQGTGYARTTTQELVFIQQVAQETGIFLDPVYSGKALYHLIQDLNRMPDKFVGRTILFIHTGGFFGLYDKVDQLKLLLRKNQIERFYMD